MFNAPITVLIVIVNIKWQLITPFELGTRFEISNEYVRVGLHSNTQRVVYNLLYISFFLTFSRAVHI